MKEAEYTKQNKRTKHNIVRNEKKGGVVEERKRTEYMTEKSRVVEERKGQRNRRKKRGQSMTEKGRIVEDRKRAECVTERGQRRR